jgi:hypothetical protein
MIMSRERLQTETIPGPEEIDALARQAHVERSAILHALLSRGIRRLWRRR